MNIFEGKLAVENGAMIFDGGSIRCPLPREQADMLRGRENQKVCLGIRPRALHLVRDGETPDIVLEGQVDLSEMLGEEVLVHIESGPHQYITSIHPHEIAALKGDVVRLTPDLALAHVFDAESGRNLTLPAAVRQQTVPA
jgi:ABC-type sugar transport system ATPase subunit